MLMLGETAQSLQRLTRDIMAETKYIRGAIKVDVDPLNFM
jgi:hypothetical protein